MSEERMCQSCKGQFKIAPEDFSFYEKIQVPPPTWCQECRTKRRLAYYIDLLRPQLYKRKSDATGKDIIGIYPENTPFPVYEKSFWDGDGWDPLSYGKEYDFAKSFFQQFYELQLKVPRYHTYGIGSVNCDYCAASTRCKDCYLSCGIDNENAYYSAPLNSKEVCDSWIITYCELVYETVNSNKCYKVFFSEYAENCSESAFLYDCANCSNCFGCVGLKNKSYYFFNEPCSREIYFEKVRQYDLRTYSGIEKAKKDFDVFRRTRPQRFAHILNSEDCTGDNIRNSKNVKYGFDVMAGENCKYCSVVAFSNKECYDSYDSSGTTYGYENVASGGNSNNIKFCYLTVYDLADVEYSDSCRYSNNLFGCVGLQKKSYCILNKQYTKEEYDALVPKIKQHMLDMPYTDKLGRTYAYGEFFPSELSLTPYHQNVAQEYYPLTTNEARAQGYFAADEAEVKTVATIKAANLPEHINDVDDVITKESVEDLNGHTFRFIQQEVDLYKKMGIALPRLCPMCRFTNRRMGRNRLTLQHGSCQCSGETSENGVYKNTVKHFHENAPCKSTFETSYKEDVPGILYCNECFQSELIS